MNYNIEDNLDLFTEINNCILDNQNTDDNESNISNTINNICLLTNLPLEENYITLSCNHRFNYLAIYEETCNQKKYNYLDTEVTRSNELKCPYCRSITKNILPYFCRYNVQKIRGVTNPAKYSMKLYSCEYSSKCGKAMGFKCNNSAFISNKGTLCNTHYKNIVMSDDNQCLDHEKEYLKMTIPVLKTILRANGCKVGGIKSSLIKRICSEKQRLGSAWVEII